ncbi:UPF0280 family protein [Aliishimia ponticola]|uniref:UPF0280 family protein n=1 Tax=Aliishimia ponticola TaxID=2499833 RepID=A0A4S4NIS9_9RHOB|nr:UPF0280 family protein [Aliishimia ponticola]THH38128.1 UPF0280 family protein [Aliishimia ponticola]
MSVQAVLLGDGRLHLTQGPIDLVVDCDIAARQAGFDAAHACFTGLLDDLVRELPTLRAPMTPGGTTAVTGSTALRMVAAVRPHAGRFVTPMAAVAGAVADTVLAAMCAALPLRRAYVNNGGDIALHLAEDARFTIAISDQAGTGLGRITVTGADGICGIATSGRHGRSHSLGIADSVTVLARSAAQADAAATLIANAVDLPGHPAIRRVPAHDLSPDSDLGARLVTTGCDPLPIRDIGRALAAGTACADTMRRADLIHSAALFLQGQSRLSGPLPSLPHRSLTHA